MVESLNKGIKNFILPMYPWIIDFDIIPIKISDIYLKVNYYTDGPFIVTDELKDIEDITASLFKMLGGSEKSYRLGGVDFKSIEYKD